REVGNKTFILLLAFERLIRYTHDEPCGIKLSRKIAQRVILCAVLAEHLITDTPGENSGMIKIPFDHLRQLRPGGRHHLRRKFTGLLPPWNFSLNQYSLFVETVKHIFVHLPVKARN